MRRKALVVGIDHYDNLNPLGYAERDAREIARRLKYDGDEVADDNFDVNLLLSKQQPVTRARLREAIHNLFVDAAGLDLIFYFAGHGFVSDAGGYLVTSDGRRNDYGVTMEELVMSGRASAASSVLIMLDCCHAGAAGDVHDLPPASQRAVLSENMAILAASLPMQQALESSDGGMFSAAVRDALDGAAADIFGEVTVAAVYSTIEKRFGWWQQRPVAKLYMTRPIVLRRVKPRLSRLELRQIVEFFATPDHRFQMDPDYDPERDRDGVSRTPEVRDKIEIGRLFKRYRDAALLNSSVPGEDLYYTAQRSHTVELTLFGREYWRYVRRRM